MNFQHTDGRYKQMNNIKKELKTIKDIENIDIDESFFTKNSANQKFVSLKIKGKSFTHRFFKRDDIGDYINYKKQKYYYPWNNHIFLI